MKKMTLVAALALMAGVLFAQGNGYGPGDGAMMGQGRGPGFGPDVDWKIGTVVTTEYKKVTGQISIGQTLAPFFKAEGIEYQIRLPRSAELATLKNGDTITVEGTFTTVKSEAKLAPMVHPFKITYNGKEVDLTNLRGGMGFKQDDRDPEGRGPRR